MGQRRLEALHARDSKLNAAATIREARTGLDQAGPLPERLKGAVVKEQHLGLHGTKPRRSSLDFRQWPPMSYKQPITHS
jgi:hypothetical protein